MFDRGKPKELKTDQGLSACVNRLLLLGLGLVALCLAVPSASAEPTLEVQPFADLAFTDVSQTREAVQWEQGYAVATHGGLVLWPGGEAEARQIVTTTDGLPSNLVWDVTWTEEKDRLLVATEGGVVSVDPWEVSVSPVEAPPVAQPALTGFAEEITVTEEGDWWILERGGNVTHRTSDGQWETFDIVPKKRANDLYVDGGRVLSIGESPDTGPEGYQNWSVFELADDGSWTPTHHTEKAPVHVASFAGMDIVGMREGGIQAFEDGEKVDLGAPDELDSLTVYDIVPDGDRLLIATNDGLFVYKANSGEWASHGPGELPVTWITDVVPAEETTDGLGLAMFSSPWGLHLPGENADWQRHTGINGPEEHNLLSVTTKDGNQVWTGSGNGVNIFFPTVRLWNQWDQSELGLQVDASRTHDIVHGDNMTWFATDRGVYQLDWEAEKWRVIREENPPTQPGNTFYDVEKDGEWLWMPHWGSGLMRHKIGTETTVKYRMFEGLISHGVTCAERWQEYLAVCSDRGFQVFDLSRASRSEPIGPSYDRCNNYNCNYTAPHNTTFDALADGPRIWVGSAHEGLLSYERDSDKGIALEAQWGPEDGLPSKEVRAIEPAAEGVWVATTGGLARVTLDGGVEETWTAEDGLGQAGVNDVKRLGDVLYLATYEGLHRLDLNERELLPLFEGAGSTSDMPGHVSITFPDRGSRLSSALNMTGTASVPGRPVEEVQVRIDDGEWETAEGTSEWSYRLPVPELERGQHVAEIRVMANGTNMANTTFKFHVEELADHDISDVRIQHDSPSELTAGRTHFLTVTLDAPEPWHVEMDARLGERQLDPKGRTAGDEVTFTVPIPERSADTDLHYRFLVKSGAGERWFPLDGTYNASVTPRLDRSVVLELDTEEITVSPGETTTLEATIHNNGQAVENLTADVNGLHSSWVSVEPTSSVHVPPDQPLGAEATIEVPEDATPGATSFTFSVESDDARVHDTQAFKVEVVESAAGAAGGSEATQDTPGLTATAALLATALAVVLARAGRGDER